MDLGVVVAVVEAVLGEELDDVLQNVEKTDQLHQIQILLSELLLALAEFLPIDPLVVEIDAIFLAVGLVLQTPDGLVYFFDEDRQDFIGQLLVEIMTPDICVHLHYVPHYLVVVLSVYLAQLQQPRNVQQVLGCYFLSYFVEDRQLLVFVVEVYHPVKNEKDRLVNPLAALVKGSIFDYAEVLEVVLVLVEFVPGKFGAEVIIEPAPVEEGEHRGEAVL